MAYNKHTWEQQELITAEKLNNLELGVAENQGNGSSYQIISVDNNKIMDIDKVDFVDDLDYNRLVLTDTFSMYSAKIDLTNISNFSFSVQLKHINGLAGKSGSRFGLQMYDANNVFVEGSKYSTWYANTNWQTEKLENIAVPANAKYLLVRFYSATTESSNILKIAQPMLNSGSVAMPYTKDGNNLLKNSSFEVSLNNWYPTNNETGKMSALSTFIEVEPEINNYRIENSSAVTGTLPSGLLAGSLSGAFLSVRGSSVNGVGGVMQSLETQGNIYQRVFNYQWSDWKLVNGVYGSFNESGVWHSVYGDPVVGGVVYSPENDHFYALDNQGKTINTIGYVTAPAGSNNKQQSIKLKSGGIVDSDISDSDIAASYVTSVNSHLSGVNDPAIQTIVTDTHGTSKRQVLKAFNKLLSGFQYNNLIQTNDITPANSLWVSKDEAEVKHSGSPYYQAISRAYAKDSFLNIDKISSSFDKPVTQKTHLGDVEDGTNYTALEEIESYNETASGMLSAGYDMIDGNHDEQIYDYERGFLSKGNTQLGNPIGAPEFSRRVDTDRFKNSYGKDQGYYSKYDDVHKLVYIFLDTFEGGEVKNKTGSTPDFGVPLGQGKMTSRQLNWLVSELKSIPDDYYVVINSHHVPQPDMIGATPTGPSSTTWWVRNINPNVLSGILIAFQNSSSYSGKSEFQNVGNYDLSAYDVSVNVDFSNKPTGRIIMWNYGHHHTYGHRTKAENGNFNIITHPNMLSQYWDKIGNPSGSQFTTEIIDTENKKIHVIRFAPTKEVDSEFILDF